MIILSSVKKFLRQIFPSIYEKLAKRDRDILRVKYQKIFSDPSSFDSLCDDAFTILQNSYQGVPEYGYDSFSTWIRGADRCKQLLSLGEMKITGSNVLEVACGDGMASFLLQGYGHKAQLADIEDWRDERAKSLLFTTCDVCTVLPFESSTYDLVFSYNAFEHFPDPEAALMEMVRVCKPGGLLYFEFGPLYASPWGLHAYRTLKMPYPQFLFSMDFILIKLHELGIWDLGKERTELQPTNGWRYEQFRQLWRKSGCDIITEKDYRDASHLELILQYPECFRGRGLTFDDVTVQALFVTLRKKPML